MPPGVEGESFIEMSQVSLILQRLCSPETLFFLYLILLKREECYLQMQVVTVLAVDLDVLGEESWRKTCGCD